MHSGQIKYNKSECFGDLGGAPPLLNHHHLGWPTGWGRKKRLPRYDLRFPKTFQLGLPPRCNIDKASSRLERSQCVQFVRWHVLREVFCGFGYFVARWAPTKYKWCHNPYEWPYKWVTGVTTPRSGVITLQGTMRCTPTNVPLWEIPISTLYSGNL